MPAVQETVDRVRRIDVDLRRAVVRDAHEVQRAGVPERDVGVERQDGANRARRSARAPGIDVDAERRPRVDVARAVDRERRGAHDVEDAILMAQPKIAKVLVHIEPTRETRY